MTDSPYHRFNGMKILAYADRLRQIADGGMPMPLDWHVYPSNICNHACSFCMFRQNGEQENFPVKLSRDLLLRAVEDAARTGAVLMHFSGGGEPLLNRYTLEAMTAAQETGRLKVALSTNGSLLTPEVAAQVDYIRVSLNAGTADTHHATNHAGDHRHPGDWGKIIQNVRCAVKSKRQDIGLAFVIERENVPDIFAFCEVAAETGVDFVHIRPGFYYDHEKDAATRAAMADAFTECERARAAFGSLVDIYAITDKFDGYWTPRTYHQCRAIWTGTTLRATGDFAVCQDRTDLVWGNTPSYRDGASFEDCWRSEERQALVARIHDGQGGLLPSCPRCVWSGRNTILQDVFVEDSMRLALV